MYQGAVPSPSPDIAPLGKSKSAQGASVCGRRGCPPGRALVSWAARAQIGKDRRNLAMSEQLLRPTSAIRLDAAVTAFRTTHSEESPFVAPEYPPLDIADPHKSQPHALARPSPCLPPSVSTYAALIDWRPPALRRGANSRAELPHRSADANGDDTGPPLVRPGHRPLLRRLHPAVDIRARAGAGRAEGVQPQGVADQASQGRVGETAPPGAAQGRIGRYVEALSCKLR
jgi:hypothetical protein